MNKWIGISLGTIFGLSHIGMIGMISRQSKFPVVNLPVGPYTAYTVKAGKEGYLINYRANDPLVMEVTRNDKRPAGFLGLGTKTTQTRELYTMDGTQHLEGRKQGNGLSPAQIACIKAEGAGSSTGGVIGASVGAQAAPALSQIPIIGWVAGGWATMFGQKTGANLGGDIAKAVEGC